MGGTRAASRGARRAAAAQQQRQRRGLGPRQPRIRTWRARRLGAVPRRGRAVAAAGRLAARVHRPRRARRRHRGPAQRAAGCGGAACPPDPGPGQYDEVLVYVDAAPDWRAHLEANSTTPWSSGVPMPRSSPGLIEGFAAGMHDVLGRPDLRRTTARDTLIAHLPFTTFERFARKVVNIREVHRYHEEYATGRAGWHWLRWARRGRGPAGGGVRAPARRRRRPARPAVGRSGDQRRRATRAAAGTGG